MSGTDFGNSGIGHQRTVTARQARLRTKLRLIPWVAKVKNGPAIKQVNDKGNNDKAGSKGQNHHGHRYSPTRELTRLTVQLLTRKYNLNISCAGAAQPKRHKPRWKPHV